MSSWNDDVLFSSKNMCWQTPHWLFDELNETYGFNLDAAATKESSLCIRHLGPGSSLGEDALAMERWPGSDIWLNPPYGRDVGMWVQKAYEQSLLDGGKYVVVLVMARTDTRWWHDYAMKASRILFIKGRLKFRQGEEEGGPAPAPSVVLIFHPKWESRCLVETYEQPKHRK